MDTTPYLYREEHAFLTGKDKERIDYIRLTVEDELLFHADGFSLCKNESNQILYLYKREILETEIHVLSSSEVEEHKKQLGKLRLSQGPITIQEQHLKNNIKEIINRSTRRYKHVKKEEKKTNRSLIIAAISSFMLIVIGYTLYINFFQATTASIRIFSNEKYNRILLNGETAYITNQTINGLEEGIYQLSLIFPNDDIITKTIEVNDFKTYSVHFKHQTYKQQIENKTGLQITTNLSSYTVIIDDIKYSQKQLYELERGNHIVSVQREGYHAEPAFRDVFLSKNEVFSIPFRFTKRSKKNSKFSGSIDIQSNSKDYQIYLNGKLTHYTSDHVFRNLPVGEHSIQLIKSGYDITPANHVTTLNSKNTSKRIEFKFTKVSGNLTVSTLNQDGLIFLDGKKIGDTQITISAKQGQHTLSFSDIQGYYTPKPQNIDIHAKKPLNIIVKYRPIVMLEGTFRSSSFVNNGILIEYGGIKNLHFSTKIERNVVFENNAVVLSYPNKYNNPKSGHALKILFNTPDQFDITQALSLKVYYTISEATYSITGKSNAEISVVINNKRRFMNRSLKGITHSFPINTLLKTGQNEIIFFLTENNNVEISISKIEIKP